jgi:secreted trypsin-like serine protease
MFFLSITLYHVLSLVISLYIECGVPSVSPTSNSYVLFGNDAVDGEWPWQALLFMDGSSGCGATLIDPYYAITASHCVVYVC